MQNFYGKTYIMTGLLTVSTPLFTMEPNTRPTGVTKPFSAPKPMITTAEEQEAAILARANHKLKKAYQQLEDAELAYRKKRLMMTESENQNCRII